MMAAFQDESVQIRGIVLVPYEVDRNFSQVQNHSLKDRLSSIPMYQEALPIRIASMHHCFNNPTINTVIKLFSRMYDKGTRMRFRFHSGTIDFILPFQSISVDFAFCYARRSFWTNPNLSAPPN